MGLSLRDPSKKPPAPAAGGATGTGQSGALTWARTQIGKPYLWGATGPGSYDCSGLTMRAYEAAGLTLPRNSRQQHAATVRITEAELQPGDLVFWSRNGQASGIYHVALYAGDGRIVQAPSAGKNVEDQVLYRTNLYGFGRLP